MAEPTFTYAELIEWSKPLPSWQRDGLRRVLASGELTSQDLNEVAALARRAEGKVGVPADESHVRDAAPSAAPVRLLGLSNISRVNALAKGPVKFGPEGLTIVYGDNAAGKSGVIRVLKKACRAADPGGDILPSIFEDPTTDPAAATIHYRVGEEAREFGWTAGSPAPTELASVTVFDCDCAVVQVEKQNRISYTPEILTTFQRLAALSEEVATGLRAERDALGQRATELTSVGFELGDGVAAKALAALSARTDSKAIHAQVTLSPDELERRITLREALKDNPVVQIQLTRTALEQARGIDAKLKVALERLSDTALERLDHAQEAERNAVAAASAAAEAFAKGAELAGLGGQVWKELWEAARRFSTKAVYPGLVYPNTETGARCVLCQEPLSGAAQARLRSFEDFVVSDLERKAETARAVAREDLNRLGDVVLPSGRRACSAIGLDRLVGEGRLLREFLISAKLRRRAAVLGRASRPFKPTPDLDKTIAGIQGRLSAMQEAASAEGRQRLVRELAELDDRAKLTPLLDAAAREVGRLQKLEKLNAWIEECDTGKITRKAREAAKSIVTGRLRSAFSTNLTKIGFASTGVEVVLGEGERAVHPYKVGLMASPGTKPADVLSEGERTCVALAGFLGELEVTGNTSGVVLDDPVTSLDHHYRESVAERLAEEAKVRQVVVFTHDIVFLWMLRKHASQMGVKRTELSVERGYHQHGVVKEGPPWEAMPVAARVKRLYHELRQAEKRLETEDRPGYEQDVEGIYKRLRATWERGVEETLLGEVVQRFAKEIQTKRLRHLSDIKPEDIETVTREMTRCSNYAHDDPGAANIGIPDPAVVGGHIKTLEDWGSAIEARRK